MQQFHDLLREALERGIPVPNARTGLTCHVVVGPSLRFDLRDGFPAITTKKLAFGAVKGELLGFFRGYQNAAQFRELGCKIWDQNANEARAWLDNRHRKGHDDLGRIYGAQWTDWRDLRVAETPAERDALAASGFETRMHDDEGRGWLMGRSIHQLENALRKLITDPSDRRIIVSAWRPDELDRMALPPCHMDYRFVAIPHLRELHMVMTLRSWDLFLGGPFNIATSALFLEIMARLAGLRAATLTMQAANAHIYSNHVEQVREQLARAHHAAPNLVLADGISPVTGLGDIVGTFARIEPEWIRLDGYTSHDAIRAPMAA